MGLSRHPALRWVLGLLLLGALVFWVQHSIGWGAVLGAWERVPPRDLLLVALLTLVGYLARSFRLAAHFGGELRGAPARCFRVMALHNVANNFLPFRTGELSFPLLLRQEFGIETARSVGALLWLRALDLSAIVVAAALSLGIFRLGPVWGLLIAATGLALPGIGWRWLGRGHRSGGWAGRLASGLPIGVGSLVAGQMLTLVHWGTKLAAWAWLISHIGHIEGVLAWTGAVAGELTSVLPIHGIAGAGTYEGGIVLALQPFGVPVDDALLAATDLHLFMLAFALVVGVLAWALIRR